MKENEEGFSTPLAMIIIFSLSLMVISLSLFLSATERKIYSYKKEIKIYKEIDCLVLELEKKLQDLKSKSCDLKKENILLNDIGEIKNVTIRDVSTGINRNFIGTEFIENEAIHKYVNFYGEDAFTDYGWINLNFANIKILEEIREEYKELELFPLVNTMPLLNIYYMNEDFLKAILELYRVKDADRKIIDLKEKLEDELEIKEIAEILGIKETHDFFNLVGTKTVFWEICFEKENYKVNAVYAAVPERDKQRVVSKYILIEKNIRRNKRK